MPIECVFYHHMNFKRDVNVKIYFFFLIILLTWNQISVFNTKYINFVTFSFKNVPPWLFVFEIVKSGNIICADHEI